MDFSDCPLDWWNECYAILTGELNVENSKFFEEEDNNFTKKKKWQGNPYVEKQRHLNNLICDKQDTGIDFWQNRAIIGHVDLVDIVENSKSKCAEPDCYHWILENSVLFKEPITGINGKLNIWDYELANSNLGTS